MGAPQGAERQTVPGTGAEWACATGTSETASSSARGDPAIDLVVPKLRRPVLRPGTVRRSSLIERMAGGDRCPIVSVVAPAGYGKTTLLAQWAERGPDFTQSM